MPEINNAVMPVKFHRHPSIVQEAILEMKLLPVNFTKLKYGLIEAFIFSSIAAVSGEKIVFECVRGGKRIFYGFNNQTFCVGFAVCNQQ